MKQVLQSQELSAELVGTVYKVFLSHLPLSVKVHIDTRLYRRAPEASALLDQCLMLLGSRGQLAKNRNLSQQVFETVL